jgi:tRNA C32,U32 (ribose-2'-O)-methylase TrmJ
MKYLKRYNENNLDINHAVVKIKEYFTEDTVSEMLADEIKEWSDEDNYKSINNGEAEEMVLYQIISWYEKEFKQLNEEQKKELQKELKQIYKTFL